MPEKMLVVFKETDKKATSYLVQIAQRSKIPGAVLDVIFENQTENLANNLPIEGVEEETRLQEVLALNTALCNRFVLKFPSEKGVMVTLDREAYFDRFRVILPQNAEPSIALPLITAATSLFTVYQRTEAMDKLLGDELAEFYRQREKGLCQLEGLSQKLIEQNEAYRRELDLEKTTRNEELRAEWEAEKERLQQQYDAKEQELQTQKAELTTRLNEIDDNETRHARRQIRQDLKRLLAERAKEFSLSKGTNNKRWPIHILFSLLVLAAAVFFTIALKDAFNFPDGVNPLLPMLRFSFSALALAAAIIFYIRWNDSWFRQHADEEFKLKRLDLDIDRASWVVEMAMEWKDEKGTEIPAELISTLSRNLFVAGKDGDRAKHPSEDLASAFLSASSGIRLAIPGVGEVCFDQKGVKKFGQKIADGKERQGNE